MALAETHPKPKILFYDIETMANLAYVWGKYEQDVIAYRRHWYMLCFGYKWLDDKKTHIKALPDYPLYKKDRYDDSELVKDLHSLMEQADIIVAHNGRKFDIKKSNARFIKHGLAPLSPFKIIDTKDVAKKHFRFDSNKLDDLGDYLGIGRKINTGGFELWLKCQDGDPAAWAKMKKYNVQDVILLEKVYKKMLPFMDNHPNISLMRGLAHGCPNCGSVNIVKVGFRYTRVSVFQQWKCKECGSYSYSPLKEGSQVR